MPKNVEIDYDMTELQSNTDCPFSSALCSPFYQVHNFTVVACNSSSLLKASLLRASLRTALSGDLYVPRTRRRFGHRAFAVAAPCVWNIVYLLTSNSTGRWQHLSNAVLKLFYLTGLHWIYVNDSVMRFRSFSRKRNINTLVTVTVKLLQKLSCSTVCVFFRSRWVLR